MKKTILLIVSMLLAATMGSAQLYNIEGNTGVRSTFEFVIDDLLNKVTVNIDNNVAGVNGANGRITSFGFLTPFTDLELGTNGFNTAFAHTAPGTWSVFEPYKLQGDEGIYFQSYGVGTGTTEQGGGGDPGIAFGTSATFIFTFPDFVGTDGWAGIGGLSVRYQSVVDSQGVAGQSDKILGRIDGDDGNPGGIVPEPSTYGLIGAMLLLGLVVMRKRS